MLTREQEIARKIGLFYLEKNGNDYAKTEEDLNKLRISRLEFIQVPCKTCGHQEERLQITLERVGLLIGKRGENIDKLVKYLGQEVNIKEEDHILSWLIPIDYESEIDDAQHCDAALDKLYERDCNADTDSYLSPLINGNGGQYE